MMFATETIPDNEPIHTFGSRWNVGDRRLFTRQSTYPPCNPLIGPAYCLHGGFGGVRALIRYQALLRWPQPLVRLFVALSMFPVDGAGSEGHLLTASGAFSASGTTTTVIRRGIGAEAANVPLSESSFSFWYSNGWWRIRLFPEGSDQVGIVWDCMRIVDGVRLIESPAPDPLQSAEVVTVANAYSTAYPPADRPELLLVWLTLCPKPTLPTLNDNQIRRFLLPALSEDTRNVGTFERRYLQPDATFLLSLQITNNGVGFSLDGTALKFGPPFDSGFHEFSYEVTETTEHAGLRVPQRARLRHLGPSPQRHNGAIDVLVKREIAIDSYASLNPLGIPESPEEIMAMDARPLGLPYGGRVAYMLTNDVWPTATSGELVSLANITRQRAEATATKNRPWLFRAVLALLMMLSIPLVFHRYKSSRAH